MSKARDIKRRIRSVKNTMQMTKAMKMVSAAKLRRAQDRMLAARPYAQQMEKVLQSLASRATPEDHPLLKRAEGERVELIVVSGDRGLCGAFNTNILRQASNFAAEQNQNELTISCVGRKGHEHFKRRGFNIRGEWLNVMRNVDFALAAEISQDMMKRFLDGDVDKIYVAYNEFKSASTQNPVVQQLLPIASDDLAGEEDGPSEEYIYEPNPAALFKTLLPKHVQILIFRALLESVAAEHAARMTAMDAATNNAGELIESLTLTMNRARQAAITTEIIEVVSGAQALG